jgi:hypothetical protein
LPEEPAPCSGHEKGARGTIHAASAIPEIGQRRLSIKVNIPRRDASNTLEIKKETQRGVLAPKRR